ncbi:MAG: alcohol dehydrogenase catalytic domain-containing protein, partial [Chloroflexota bacterium]|nr:alcohol dehydrogenase catalytic domain-containing protein [Chloroflexota bacterium]
MIAVRSHAAGEPLRIEEVAVPKPRGSEIRVKVAGCGVCHTDLYIARTDRMRVTRPLTLGHVVGGWIDASTGGAAAELKAAGLHEGDRVLVFGGWG